MAIPVNLCRALANEQPWRLSADFRQGLEAQRLAWGLIARFEGPSTSWRRDEVDEFRTRSPYLDAFLEHRATAKLTTELG